MKGVRAWPHWREHGPTGVSGFSEITLNAQNCIASVLQHMNALQLQGQNPETPHVYRRL